MTPEEFFDKFEAFAALSGSAEKVRKLILRLAVQGRLLSQDESDEPAQAAIGRLPALPPPARFDKRSRAQIEGVGAMSVGASARRVPFGWSCTQLIQIAKLESGHTPSRTRSDWWNGAIPWVGLVDARLHDGRTIYETLQHTNEAGLANSAARLLPAGTVCISRTASVGYVVVLGRPMATSQDFVNWVPTSVVTSDWLRLVFTAEKDGFGRFSKGAVHQTIYYPEWLSMYVMLPPLPEQKRIVAEVDELMALCDRLEEQQKEREIRHSALARASLARFADAPTPANLTFLFHNSYPIAPADLRKSVLTLAVQGKLVPENPNDEPPQATFPKLGAAAVESEDDGFPSRWLRVALGDAGEWRGGGTPSKSRPDYWEGDLPWVSPKDMKLFSISDAQDHISKTAVEDSSVRLIPAGSLLMVVRGMILARAFPVALTTREVTINQDMKALLPWESETKDYLLVALRAFESQIVAAIERSSHGTCKLKTEFLQEFLVGIPPLAEQRRIVTKVDQLMALVDELETQLAASRATTTKLLDAIVGELTA